MVLQRAPQRANIWGWTTPGATVTVTFDQKTYKKEAETTGAWNVLLDATAAGGPYTISVSSSAGTTATLEDILFGDVFVCSGQSNMQMTVHSAFNATLEIAAADAYNRIRLFTVGQGTTSETALDEFKTISQAWSVASAATVGVGDWSAFSAACWFFGRDLYDTLQVPLGLINDNWGGTPVQAWSSPDALKLCPGSPVESSSDKYRVGGPNDPSQLWNAMIVPILPMTILGATWYQGEANAGQSNYYACAFPAMISDWRAKWGGETEKNFGFFFVQLAPWLNGDDNSETLTRLSQMYATALPRVGVATAMDWGDPTSPFGDIHPRFKQIVGYRLHLAALAISYHQRVQYLGPEAMSYTVVQKAPSAVVRVDFKPETVGSGLILERKDCDAGVPITQCGWYDIQADGKWINGTVTISGNAILISAILPSAANVTGVRYAWGNYPVATLYNKEGLPALPFAFPNPIKPTRMIQ